MGARQPGLPSAGLHRHLPLHHLQRGSKIALLGPGAWRLGQNAQRGHGEESGLHGHQLGWETPS